MTIVFILTTLAFSVPTTSAFADGLGVCGSTKLERFFIPDSWGNASFRDACANHDACYGRFGENKADCDDRFYSNMYDACSNAYPSAFHTIQREACYEIAYDYWYAVHKMGGDAYREAQSEAQPSSSGVLIPGSARDLEQVTPYGLVCLVNRTDWDINYRFRWGDGEWRSRTVSADRSRYHWWDYAPGSHSSPNFEIRFDADFTNGTNYRQYDLERYRAANKDCWDGKVYEFKKVGSNAIGLYDSGN
jgi:hypothetical protein